VNNPSPSRIMLIAGGAVLLISTFLEWTEGVDLGEFGSSDGFSGIDTDAFGLLGIWCLLIGGAVAVLTALTTFGNINLPARVLGFTWTQLYLMFGLAAFLITFGLQFIDGTAFGVTLGWIASAVIVAGAFMELQSEGKRAGSVGGGTTPPRPF
jgi:hypothetical protein